MTISRRDLLKSSGSIAAAPVLGNILSFLSSAVVQFLAQDVLAQTEGYSPAPYIYFHQHGAPARWMTDLLLTPHGATNFVSSTGVATRFLYDSGTGSLNDSTYDSSFTSHGLFLPPIWQYSLPKNGGGSRAQTDYLANALFIRGCNMLQDGHVNNATKMIRPLAGNPSVDGLNAVKGNTIMPLVAAGSSFLPNSEGPGGILPIRLQWSPNFNMIKSIMGPFFRSEQSKHLLFSDSTIDAALSKATLAIDQNVLGHTSAFERVRKDKNNAARLLKSMAMDLDQVWLSLSAKYQALVAEAILPLGGKLYPDGLPFLSNYPILVDQANAKRFDISSSAGVVSLTPGFDARQLFDAQTSIDGLSNLFALTEFLVTQGLTTSMVVSLSGFTGLNFNGHRFSSVFDEHNTGGLPSLLLNAFYFRGFSSCLLELIDQMKLQKLTAGRSYFDAAVIQVGSEFNRSPNAAGTTSDHGWQAASTTLISGKIKGPSVIGNIYAQAVNPTTQKIYPGTWGHAAPNKELAGKQIEAGHVANTVAKLLGAQGPSSLHASLVDMNQNTAVPKLGPGRILNIGEAP